MNAQELLDDVELEDIFRNADENITKILNDLNEKRT
jgi:hypothetical protein